jgi:ribosomal protein L37AE/L43A
MHTSSRIKQWPTIFCQSAVGRTHSCTKTMTAAHKRERHNWWKPIKCGSSWYAGTPCFDLSHAALSDVLPPPAPHAYCRNVRIGSRGIQLLLGCQQVSEHHRQPTESRFSFRHDRGLEGHAAVSGYEEDGAPPPPPPPPRRERERACVVMYLTNQSHGCSFGSIHFTWIWHRNA